MVAKRKERSALLFEVLIWSPEYYRRKYKPKVRFNLYNGQIRTTINNKKRSVHFHSPAQFLREFEKLFYKKLK